MSTTGQQVLRRSRQVGLGLLYAVAGMLTLLFLLNFWLHFAADYGHFDAISYYFAGRIVLNGQGPALYDLTLQHSMQVAIGGPTTAEEHRLFVYPPWVALISALLALLPYSSAYIGFVALQALALGGAAHQLARLVPARRLPLVLGAMALTPSVAVILGHPQWSAWVLWSLAGALAAARQGQPLRVGGWLILGLVKPSLLVPGLLWAVVTRQWRALAVFATGGAILSLGSIPIFGFWWLPWLHAVQSQDAFAADQEAMPTLRGLLTLVGMDLGLWTTSLVGVGLLAGLLWKAPAATRPLLTLLAGWLLIPHAYIHDLIILVAPLAILYTRYGSTRPLLRVLGPLTWLGGLLPQAVLALPICALIALLVRARPEPGDDSPAATGAVTPAAPPGSATPA